VESLAASYPSTRMQSRVTWQKSGKLQRKTEATNNFSHENNKFRGVSINIWAEVIPFYSYVWMHVSLCQQMTIMINSVNSWRS